MILVALAFDKIYLYIQNNSVGALYYIEKKRLKSKG